MKKFKVQKSFQEINERIRRGKAVVVTAEEMIDIVERHGAVDAVTCEDIAHLAGELFRSETLSAAVMGPVRPKQAFDFRMT